MTTKEQIFFNQAAFKNKIHFISLGCSRNLVDSEVMLGILLKAGYVATESLSEADYLILNTCGFLKAARNESLQHLQHVINTKKASSKIILTGCMVSKHKEELKPWLPHVHYVLGSGDVEHILSAIESKESGEKLSAKSYLEMGEVPRKLSTPKHYAYLKISEGCRKQCAFCIIPSIKGRLKSKPIEQVVKEFRLLIKSGAKEIILIAQDLGDYGKDFSPDRKSLLAPLLQELLKESGNYWIRMLYLYPDEIDESIIQIMEKDSRLLPYVDIPLQHIHNRVLKDMRRTTLREDIFALISKLRARIPHIYIRSSFIVGFPGETDEEFQDLVDFVALGWIDNVGIFPYSQEKGSIAAKFSKQIPSKVKAKRLNILSQVQQKNVVKHNKKMVGRVLEAVIDGYHPDSKLLLTARFYGQAPEVDACIIVNEARMVSGFGDRCLIEITGASGYDLIGRVIKKIPE